MRPHMPHAEQREQHDDRQRGDKRRWEEAAEGSVILGPHGKSKVQSPKPKVEPVLAYEAIALAALVPKKLGNEGRKTRRTFTPYPLLILPPACALTKHAVDGSLASR